MWTCGTVSPARSPSEGSEIRAGEQRGGCTAAYLLPPLVDVPAGAYPIGEDEAITWAFGDAAGMATGHMPRHSVDVETFRIGRFPVTNAEWSCFVAAGGYQDLRWWEDGGRPALAPGRPGQRGRQGKLSLLAAAIRHGRGPLRADGS